MSLELNDEKNEIIQVFFWEWETFIFFMFFLLFWRTCAYTEYAGCAITTAIPVKFGTAHGRTRPEVGSTKCIEAYGRNGVNPAPQIFGTSYEKMITSTVLLISKHNFYSLTVCRLNQY